MPRTAIGTNKFVLGTSFSLLCALWVGPLRAQGLPQPGPNAKSCAYLPVTALEAHFGAKAQNIQGIDQSTRNTCGARLPDPLHAAVVESHPPSAVDQAMTAAERLAFLKEAMKEEILDTRDFGSVGCFQSTVDMGQTVRVTTCFLAKAPYLALSLHSVDPAQVSYEAVKGLLEQAAVQRK
jgi:hypothetical protein